MKSNNLFKQLPLTESTSYIMMVLNSSMHGYAVMKQVELLSEGTVKIGAGTMYGTLSSLEKKNLIEKTGEDNRRKTYKITADGRMLLNEHIRRTSIFLNSSKELL